MVTPLRTTRLVLVAVATAGLATAGLSAQASDPSPPVAPVRQQLPLPDERVVRVHVPGSEALYAMEDAGYDFTGQYERVPDGVVVDALLTAEQLAGLDEYGATVAAQVAATTASAPSAASAPAAPETAADADAVVVGRVDWFTTKGQGFLSVEAKTDALDGATLTLSWDGGSVEMPPYVDSGEYLYHRVLARVDGPRPDEVTVTSSLGGSATAPVTDWLYETDADVDRPGYEYGFVDGYLNPTEIYERLDELHAEHPDVTEIVELPYRTNGYQRLAQAVFGTANASRVAVDSLAWGHEGGNDISVELADPGVASSALDVTVDGDAITVHLATDAAGVVTSTAAQVVAALNAEAGTLIRAYTYRGDAGAGVVAPAPPTLLSDFLSAPNSVERGPFPLRALRIGEHRDGSKPGVLIIAQDHAREWVTPLVALEAAERLLANRDNDPATRRILRNVDILIVPSNNPDGAHYSFFDRAGQRRNMTNHCPLTGAADANARGNWGVDLNRNYRVGSAIDGYDGASFSCTSDTYMGPDKLSEPEAKNIVWLAETFDNLKFFMTVHSYGGQLFWQPGAYIAEGRITTPRPPLRDETYYWEMAEEILSNVKGLRDTVVQPGNVGGSSDVLYSSAGNVREDLYFTYGIYAFGWEIGGVQWNPETGEWDSGGGFQPDWPEAHQQYQEYASGVIEMFEIAADYAADQQPATTRLVQERQPDGTVHVTFEPSEPASIHYTTDGSTPTTDSPVYEAAAMREPGEVIVVDETTTFRWISVDVKGQLEPPKRFTVRVR
ncbi:M14 family zinc carboxypeptidase [Jiangella rhizosphaerae]|uniref:Zinc carboxypeptidase n=1 Tax=Jiangella rhizosphaerae TaxID=2293569 RepID=A0A418KT90_9ACTN|nr:M14 family zinc carboxypeptidase [Jiangella rhizosphaerae]RIQ29599.1 zinc carboxypeptidase [Jiangella rhizosphaerae]